MAAFAVIAEIESAAKAGQQPHNEWTTPVGFKVPLADIRLLAQELGGKQS